MYLRSRLLSSPYTTTYLGRRVEAATELSQCREIPVEKGTFFGATCLHFAAEAEVMLGRSDQALDYLELLLAVPYWLSREWLMIDPNFAPLRGNARFERLASGN